MIFWLLYILAEAFVQGKSIKDGNKPLYIVLFIIRGIASIIHGITLNVQYGTWQYPILLGFQICSFYTIFDFVLNALRLDPLGYRGKESGWLDKLNDTQWYSLKVICLILSIIFYILGLSYWKF